MKLMMRVLRVIADASVESSRSGGIKEKKESKKSIKSEQMPLGARITHRAARDRACDDLCAAHEKCAQCST